MNRLQNKIAVIAGASDGIGFKVSEAFVREGATVVMLARGQDKLVAAAESLTAQGYRLTGSFLADTRTTIEAAYTRPRLAGWPEFQELLGDIIHECLSKDLAAEAAVELLETKHLAFIFNGTNLRTRSDAM